MSTSRTVAALGCLAAAAVAAPAAWAQAPDSGWYAGGNIGRSAATIDDNRIRSGLAGQGLGTNGISDRDRDTGYKLFGGYQLNRHFAIEAGWFDLGTMGYTATTTPPGTLDGDVRFKGLNLDLVGTLPLTDRVSLLARVGAARVRTQGSFAATGVVQLPYPGASTRADHTGVKFGAGIGWRVTDAVELRAEAERLRVNDSVGNRGHVDLFSVGLVYRFGGPTVAAAIPAVVAVATPPQTPLPQAPPVQVVAAPPPPPPLPPAPPAPPAPRVVRFSADALFGFDQSALRPEGRRALETFANEARHVRYDRILVVGHTDRLGSADYNARLSQRRADAVAAYLVQAGVPAASVSSRGAGESQPATATADCRGTTPTPALVACLQPDRRVDVQVEGTVQGQH